MLYYIHWIIYSYYTRIKFLNFRLFYFVISFNPNSLTNYIPTDTHSTYTKGRLLITYFSIFWIYLKITVSDNAITQYATVFNICQIQLATCHIKIKNYLKQWPSCVYLIRPALSDNSLTSDLKYTSLIILNLLYMLQQQTNKVYYNVVPRSFKMSVLSKTVKIAAGDNNLIFSDIL